VSGIKHPARYAPRSSHTTRLSQTCPQIRPFAIALRQRHRSRPRAILPAPRRQTSDPSWQDFRRPEPTAAAYCSRRTRTGLASHSVFQSHSAGSLRATAYLAADSLAEIVQKPAVLPLCVAVFGMSGPGRHWVGVSAATVEPSRVRPGELPELVDLRYYR